MASCGTIAPPNERPSSVMRLAVGRCPATEKAGRVLSVSAIPTTPGASVASAVRSEAAIGRRLIADRKSTRLNSSHLVISYAVFCLKKKKKSSQRVSPFGGNKHLAKRSHGRLRVCTRCTPYCDYIACYITNRLLESTVRQ